MQDEIEKFLRQVSPLLSELAEQAAVKDMPPKSRLQVHLEIKSVLDGTLLDTVRSNPAVHYQYERRHILKAPDGTLVPGPTVTLMLMIGGEGVFEPGEGVIEPKPGADHAPALTPNPGLLDAQKAAFRDYSCALGLDSVSGTDV